MTKKKIISKVKEIILKYANPTRIYLYGSVANNEAKQSSDIDIAYDDENCKNDFLIEDEIEKIETLIKLDVKNLARTEKRFQERVKSTSKVLYSATKKLRAQDGLYNFKNALDRFVNAMKQKESLEKEGFGEMYLDLIVKRFEFTYEMSWKALKRYLEFLGLEANSPSSSFKEGFAQGVLKNESIWLDMIEQRNISFHVYDEYEISFILDKLEDYKEAFMNLHENIANEIDANDR
jgi:nucleotidyltransferase substrate binding protein (TIGR01987 family)